MDLFELLQGQLFSQSTMDELASDAQAEPKQVETLTKLAIPTMLEALRQNASSEEGKASLDRALDDHQKDPTDVLGFLRGADTDDGAKILNHMFGSNKDNVANHLSENSGLDIGTVLNLLAKYAPMILSMLAFSKMSGQKKKATTPATTPKKKTGMDLTDVLSDLTGRSKQMNDQSSEGGILDNLKDILGGFIK